MRELDNRLNDNAKLKKFADDFAATLPEKRAEAIVDQLMKASADFTEFAEENRQSTTSNFVDFVKSSRKKIRHTDELSEYIWSVLNSAEAKMISVIMITVNNSNGREEIEIVTDRPLAEIEKTVRDVIDNNEVVDVEFKLNPLTLQEKKEVIASWAAIIGSVVRAITLCCLDLREVVK